jgi:hypothetical protein
MKKRYIQLWSWILNNLYFTALGIMAPILTLTVAALGNQVRAEIIHHVNAM